MPEKPGRLSSLSGHLFSRHGQLQAFLRSFICILYFSNRKVSFLPASSGLPLSVRSIRRAAQKGQAAISPRGIFGYHHGPMTIRVALFDMDGTIWDSPIDWLAVRREIGLPVDGRSIYMQLMDLAPQEQGRGIQILECHEALGIEKGTLVPGTEELLRCLKDAGVKCALITNNSRRSVESVLGRHPLSFDLVLSRDDGALKPDPQAFLSALEKLCARPDEALAIGDAHLDLIAAERAGIREFILVGSKPWVHDLLPVGVPHHKAVDLIEARAIIMRLLEPARR